MGIGVLADQEGRLDERLYLLDIGGAPAGSLEGDALAGKSVLDFDEEDLFEAFGPNPDAVRRDLSIKPVLANEVCGPPWDAVRSLSFNWGLLDCAETRKRYESALRQRLIESAGVQIDCGVNVRQPEFWMALRDGWTGSGAGAGDWFLTATENILFSGGLAGFSDVLLVRWCEEVEAVCGRLGYDWLSRYVAKVREQGGF